jgi:hypothetical protein
VKALAPYLESFIAPNWCLGPDIIYPILTVELAAHPLPLGPAQGPFAIEGEIRAACLISMRVRVIDKLFKVLWRGKIPEVALGKVLAGCSVANTTSPVRHREGKPCPEPFGPKPFLNREPLPVQGQADFSDVLDAHFADDGELAKRFGVCIPCHMTFALVPNMTASVLPIVAQEHRVHRGPAEFSVPKPKRSLWRGLLRPCSYVRSIPFGQFLHRRRIAREASDPIGSINDYGGW